MMDEERTDRLIQAAGRLAGAVPPERDLWPNIARQIDRPQSRRRMPMLAQAAAVLLLVGASSGLTYLAMQDRMAAVQVTAPELLFERASYRDAYGAGPEYSEIRDELAQQLEVELAKLSPETRTEVENNLALIRSAIAEINAALEAEPTNPHLQNLLLRSYQDELALMNRVGDLTRQVMSRSDI